MGAVKRYAALGLRLRNACGMAEKIRVKCHRYGWSSQWVWWQRRYSCRAVGAFFRMRFELRIVTEDKLATLVHARHAVVLAVASATRRQSRLRVLPHGQHRK